MKILLIDDEESIQKLMRSIIESAGYEFLGAMDGEQGVELARSERPDLVIMDVMMPGMDGFTATETIRAHGLDMPIIFLSAKGDIVDKGVGFGKGADDYMVKPFDPRELMMHVTAQLRRAQKQHANSVAPDVARVGRLLVDARTHRVTKDGCEVALTPKEFTIVRTLASDPGAVFSSDQLVEAAWGPDFVGETTSITVFIRKLREKIEDDPSDPKIIETVWGIGYRLAT